MHNINKTGTNLFGQMFEIFLVTNMTSDSFLPVRVQNVYHHFAHLLQELVLQFFIYVTAGVRGGLCGPLAG